MNHYEKIGLKKGRVNKWSEIGPISGPHFASNCLEADVDHLLTLDLCFKLLFLFSKSRKKGTNKKMEAVDHLLTQQRFKFEQFIDPTTHTHIYICCGVQFRGVFYAFKNVPFFAS